MVYRKEHGIESRLVQNESQVEVLVKIMVVLMTFLRAVENLWFVICMFVGIEWVS